MTKEELSILAAGAASSIEGMKSLCPEGSQSVGSITERREHGESARIERRTYYVADVKFIKTQETAATKKTDHPDGLTVRLNRCRQEFTSGHYNGILLMPQTASIRLRLLRNVMLANSWKVTTFERGELKSDGSH